VSKANKHPPGAVIKTNYTLFVGNGGLLVFNKGDLSFLKRISFRKYGLIPENF
jgi:hypothetical protein